MQRYKNIEKEMIARANSLSIEEAIAQTKHVFKNEEYDQIVFRALIESLRQRISHDDLMKLAKELRDLM